MRLFKNGVTATQVLIDQDLTGKHYLLTGCNSGLGLETMRALCARGATVMGIARTKENAVMACSSVIGKAEPLACELSDPRSIRQVIAQVQACAGMLYGIIANAGIMALPQRTLHHGIEAHMFVNHVAHFMLVNGLLDRLAPEGRMVTVASGAHAMARSGIDLADLAWDRPYSPWGAYGQSKLANILFSNALAKRLPVGQTSNSLHPGIVDTGLWRHLSADEVTKMIGRAKLRPADQCATSISFLAAHPGAHNLNGAYISNGAIAMPTAQARDVVRGEQLWAATSKIAHKFTADM